MAKILLSWNATVHDFLKGTRDVDPEGPNSSVHRHFYEGYDRHVLLTSAATPMEDLPYQRLVIYLRKTYKHSIEEVGMNLKRPDIIDVSVISKAVNSLLYTKYRHDEIDIFVSPGTSAMQVAWYLVQMSLGLRTRLFQTVMHKNGESEQVWITAEQMGYIASLLTKEAISAQSPNSAEMAIVGSLKPVYDRASRIALSDVSVLITGGTGTGKELLARYIHDRSPRAKGKFVAINCAALGNELLESRLFGHEKGAFTGASAQTNGVFREAEGGTLFLDEIGDISPYMQQSLLRALSNKEIMRVGSNKVERTNVRVLAATNKDVYDLSLNDMFRADLYYRLSTCELHLPSLIEYSAKDKQHIFAYLWEKARREFRRKDEPKLPTSIKKILMEYSYPGNIREMENIVYRIWAECAQEVKESHLPKRMLHPNLVHSKKLNDIIFMHVRNVYESCGKNISRTSKMLAISENTVRKRLGMN